MAFETVGVLSFRSVSSSCRDRFIDWSGPDGNGLGQFQLTPYHTRKDPGRVHPAGFTWYDDLIASTQPISMGGSSNDHVTVNNSPPPDTTRPTVSLTSPANGSTVSGTITVSAAASDNVGVAGVPATGVANAGTVAFIQGAAATDDDNSKTIARAFAAATTPGCGRGQRIGRCGVEGGIVSRLPERRGKDAHHEAEDRSVGPQLAALRPHDIFPEPQLRAVLPSGAPLLEIRAAAGGARRYRDHGGRSSGAAQSQAEGRAIGLAHKVPLKRNIAAGAGFTQRQSVNNKDLISEDLVQTSSGAIAATSTFSASHRYLAQMVTFKHR